MNIYESLGIRPVLNAAGPLTRLSGTILHPEVVAAMAEAAAACVRMEELQAAAGRELADATGAAAGYVMAGAAAGLALATAACIVGLDPAAMDRLPETTGLRDEIVIQRAHLTAYTHALRLAGARLVEVGYLGYPGQGGTWPWQIEAGIGPQTAAVAFSVGRSPGTVDLPTIVAIAHRHGLPVIVDAAASLPPVENLRRFIAAGADLVAFSGGKAIGGPQATGILVGRADLIASVALQHQDMDIHPATWTERGRYLANGRLAGPPHHGLGRPMKVGKEAIAGLIVALRRFLAQDQQAARRFDEERLAVIVGALADIPGVQAALLADEASPRPYATALVRIDERVLGRSVEALVNELDTGDPSVAVSQNFLLERALGLVASTLQPGEERVLAARLRDILMRRASGQA